MKVYECSGRALSGDLNHEGCRRPAIGGFKSLQVWLFCGVEHKHPDMKPMADLVHELLDHPREVGEPLRWEPSSQKEGS